MHFSNGFLQGNVGTFLGSLSLSVADSLVGTLSSSHGFLEGMLSLSDLLDGLGMSSLLGFLVAFVLGGLLSGFLGTMN